MLTLGFHFLWWTSAIWELFFYSIDGFGCTQSTRAKIRQLPFCFILMEQAGFLSWCLKIQPQREFLATISHKTRREGVSGLISHRMSASPFAVHLSVSLDNRKGTLSLIISFSRPICICDLPSSLLSFHHPHTTVTNLEKAFCVCEGRNGTVTLTFTSDTTVDNWHNWNGHSCQ